MSPHPLAYICVYICTYMYPHIYVPTHICIYTHIHIYSRIIENKGSGMGQTYNPIVLAIFPQVIM